MRRAVNYLILAIVFSTLLTKCHTFTSHTTQTTTTTRRISSTNSISFLSTISYHHSKSKRTTIPLSLSSTSQTLDSFITDDTPKPPPPPPLTTTSSNTPSLVAKWHATRRHQMLQRHPHLLRQLESTRSLPLTLPLLLLTNTLLLTLSLYSASLPLLKIILLSFTIGSTLSLWQLQILHECLHGSMLGSSTRLHKRWHRRILFMGSLPSAFGYWLYLRFGHLSHHRLVGSQSLNDAFTSPKMDLSDGDVLFVNHRMRMVGEAGPQFKIKKRKGGKRQGDADGVDDDNNDSDDGGEQRTITMAIGRLGFSLWKRHHPLRNALIFTTSFLLERCLLIINDAVVALTGKNYFFANKPRAFQNDVATYARVAVTFRLGLMAATRSWKPLLFLMLSETLWSLPPHPACAMFVTNHGCSTENKEEGQLLHPTSSTYAGRWYSALTLGTNYHCEHHDFPTVPLHKLGKIREIVGEEWYKVGSGDKVGGIMRKAFGKPDYYACMDVGALHDASSS